jgi:hypothetical protein
MLPLLFRSYNYDQCQIFPVCACDVGWRLIARAQLIPFCLTERCVEGHAIGIDVGKKADEYSRKAEVASAEAERTDDHATKQTYLDIARQWREMAAIAERLDW